MRPNGARTLGYYVGAHWFVGGISMVFIFLLSLWLLSALERTQAIVERMVVEQTAQNIRTGLKVAMVEAVISQRDTELAGWAGENPVRWLGVPPSGYSGECAHGVDVKEGVWCFERVSGDLLYRPQHAKGLTSAADGKELSVLRWRVAAGEGEQVAQSLAWLRVVNDTPYIWVIE